MEKISHILPATARVTTAEIADSQPVRPGAPSFGRPMGRGAVEDRLTLSPQAIASKLSGEAPQLEKPLTYKDSAESAKKRTIEKLSQDFFNPKIEARGTETTTSQQVLKSMEDGQDLSAGAAKQTPPVPQESHVPRVS